MRAMSRAVVTCPSSGRPVQLTKWVFSIPRRAARAFISSTKASSDPARYSASATAASLPEATATAFSRSSTVICSPASR